MKRERDRRRERERAKEDWRRHKEEKKSYADWGVGLGHDLDANGVDVCEGYFLDGVDQFEGQLHNRALSREGAEANEAVGEIEAAAVEGALLESTVACFKPCQWPDYR